MSGPDRNEFLQRLLSNDMLLTPGQLRGAYLLNVQGRPLAYFWVLQSASESWLACPMPVFEEGYRQLDAMHFGEKLQLARCPHQASLVVGPVADLQLPSDAVLFKKEGFRVIFSEQPFKPKLAPLESFEAWRISQGLSWPSDWSEKTMMLEVAQESDYLDGKGCYPGQEVVARTLHRGHVNRRLVRISGPGQPPSASCKLLHQEREVGWVSSACATPFGFEALAYVRRDFWQAGQVLDLAVGGSATVGGGAIEESHANLS